MKLIKLFSVAVTASALSVVSSHAQMTLNFASTMGASIQFNGTSSSFQFNSSGGTQWQIGTETGGTGSAIGLFGMFDTTPFSYGPVTVNNSIPGLDYETANVTGPSAGLSINDGLGDFLTGNVDWIQVATYNSVGAINGQLTVNVSGLSYSGINPDLLTLVAGAPATMNLTFQFAPAETLSQLTSGSGPYTTSFSGSIAVVPEPGAFSFLLAGGLLLGGWMLAKRRQTKLLVKA